MLSSSGTARDLFRRSCRKRLRAMVKRYPFTVAIAIGSGAVQARTKVSDVISSASPRLPDRYIANLKTSAAYFAYNALKSVMATRGRSAQEAARYVRPGMGYHPGPQAFPPKSQ